ncbi:MAG: hypothetical protein IFJ96_01625 [Acidobacteria bacterium]|nr:hypothetical protein [Candidatus Sulfomarinibacter sp. MAG AM2]
MARHCLGQHLDGDVPIQALIVRSVDLTHPALADLLDDAVVPEGSTDEVLHCQDSQRCYGIAVLGLFRDKQQCIGQS